MERHQHRRPHEKRGSEKQGSALFTTLVVIASIILIGVILYMSPLNAILKEHVVDPVAAFLKGEDHDANIVAALKEQDEQTVTPSASPSATPIPVQKTVKTVQASPYYILQMGTFLDVAAAKEHAEKLQQMGAGGVVYPDGAVYRVFAAAYSDADSLASVQAQVRADGFEATPYITEQSTVKITLEGSESALKDASDAIEYLQSVPQMLTNLSLSYDRKQMDEQGLFNKLTALKGEGESILIIFQTQTEGAMLQPVLNVIQKYVDSISTFLEERDTITVNEQSGALKRLQIENILYYRRFFDQKQQ